jgi:membrane-bound lytic murein transglycosylase MltF
VLILMASSRIEAPMPGPIQEGLPRMNPTPDIVRAFAPTGRLRASINTGNPILAAPDPATGSARGVSVDLAGGFAQRLGVPLELVVFDTAGKSVDAVTHEQADIGFFAIGGRSRPRRASRSGRSAAKAGPRTAAASTQEAHRAR